MLDARLLVVSAPHRRPIQAIWKACQEAHWPDCPLSIDVLSLQDDVGWNQNLLRYLAKVSEQFVLLLLDDHFIAKAPEGQYTADLATLLQLMTDQPNIGMVKMQAGNAASPELPVPENDRLREYDRAAHPFKRTNLVPTLFCRTWLQRLTAAVLRECGPIGDKGRNGALEFEVAGTLLTKDATKWPERMLGIHRPKLEGLSGQSFLECIASDGVREGRLRAAAMPELSAVLNIHDVPGIEAFL